MRRLLFFTILLTSIVGYSQDSAYISQQYDNYNMLPGNAPEVWEDGMRTSGEKGTYEWWYFDARLDDGSTMVVVFFTKPFVDINKDLKPFITIEIDRPDGTTLKRKYDGDTFKASTESCHVQIDNNYIKGNLKNYEMHVEIEDIKIDAQLQRTTESWRPNTGHLKYGRDDFFAWVVAVPTGDLSVDITTSEGQKTLTGTCYHDHNWGNKPLPKLINHWYWSRAKIGPYNVIASEMISEEDYNHQSITVFNLSKDGKTIADDGSQVKLYRTLGKKHPIYEKPISDDILFVYDNPQDEYRYEYALHREENILELDLLESAVPQKLKYVLAKAITGFDGAYFRMTGEVELKVYKNGTLLETHTSTDAVWELMYFGKP